MSIDKQPEVLRTVEALRLADALNRAVQQEAPDDDVICVARWFVEDSAAELRRQFEEIKRLHALNQELLEALTSIAKNSCCDRCQEAALVAKAALAKAPVAEPHKGANNE